MGLLDRYELGEVLAEGEARTCPARDRASGRAVLVHQLAGADRSRGTDLLRMIHRLLRSLPPGAHNPILDLGEHNGTMCLVTEPIPGFASIRSWLEQQIVASQAGAGEPAAPQPAPSLPPPPAEPTAVAFIPAAPAGHAQTALPGQAATGVPELPPPSGSSEGTMIVTPPQPVEAAANGGPAEKTVALEVPAAAPSPAQPGEIAQAITTTVLPAATCAEPAATVRIEVPELSAEHTSVLAARRAESGASAAAPSPEAPPPAAPKPTSPPGELRVYFRGLPCR